MDFETLPHRIIRINYHSSVQTKHHLLTNILPWTQLSREAEGIKKKLLNLFDRLGNKYIETTRFRGIHFKKKLKGNVVNCAFHFKQEVEASDDRHVAGLRHLIQINLNHRGTVQYLLSQTIRGLNVDIAIICEPYWNYGIVR